MWSFFTRENLKNMYKFKEEKMNVPCYVWSENGSIEQGAIDQIKNASSLPFVFHHTALMPDGHVGYGAPIGGVLATRDVIVPNFVGVDIGAVDKETEILTRNGWISIDKYNDEDVLVWDDYKQTSFFSKPLLYIAKPCENFTEYKNKKGLDQLLSDEHRMLIYEGYGANKTKRTYFCKNFREKLLKLKKQDYYSFRTTFPTNEKGINLTDKQIAIRVMVSADGHIRKFSDNYTEVELHFRKKRKIERSKILLKNSSVNFKEYNHKNGTTSIAFKLNWNCKKDLTDFYGCNQRQSKIIFDEYLYWDGSIDKRRNHKTYTTTNCNNADVIQYICALNGVRAGINIYDRHKKMWKDWYAVYQTKNIYVGYSKPKIINKKNGKKYCFVVETGYFIARRNKKIFITGNCGMCAVKTSLTEIDTETLKKIMGEIRKVIPVGFNHHKEAQDRTLMPDTDVGGFTIGMQEKTPVVHSQYENALKSLGSLGGGNHFLEIQKGSDGHIWIMIHSGSRNLGKQVADYYNKLAIQLNEKWHSAVPKEWQLAFLPVDSDEGQAYIREMNYCVEFALANRRLMMDRIIGCFIKNLFFPGLVSVIYADENNFEEEKNEKQKLVFSKVINIAHNYASLENHFGSNVWVHRKGATLAREGTIGIIPGSMGTKSYIVKGKGNKESFESCSHGAGRRLGRKAACEQLDFDEQKKIMDDKGIVHGMRNKDDLEEAPGAYKDINVVMENQKDLVEVLVELQPIGVIKG